MLFGGLTRMCVSSDQKQLRGCSTRSAVGTDGPKRKKKRKEKKNMLVRKGEREREVLYLPALT